MSVAVHFGEGTELMEDYTKTRTGPEGTELMEPQAPLGEEVTSRRTVVQEVLDFLRERESHDIYIHAGEANRWGYTTIGTVVGVEKDTVQAKDTDGLLFTVSWRSNGTRGFVTRTDTKDYSSCFFEDSDTNEISSEIYYM